MKKLKLFGLIFICATVLYGCGNTSLNEKLAKSIGQYYFLEQQGQWEQVFDQRVSGFKKITEKSYFVNQMKLDNKDWNLLKWQVVEVTEISENRTVVTIDFMEKIPESFAKKMGVENISAMNFTERTVWQKEDNEWLCRVCGRRTHLTLNGDF